MEKKWDYACLIFLVLQNIMFDKQNKTKQNKT